MIIVGLGNPDKKYEDTYHNVGFSAVDCLANVLGVKFKTSECRSITATYFERGKKIILAKPQTYMNLSGLAVAELAGKHKASLSDIFIIYDDIDIDLGALRVRKDGSGGTHNGMKNIIEVMNSKSIPRLRIGIGKPEGDIPLVSYVLSRISGDSRAVMEKAYEKATRSLANYITHRDIDKLLREVSQKSEQC